MLSAIEFLQTNAELKKPLPPIPDNLDNDEDITRWVLKQDIPYIKLDISFDVTGWQQEASLAEPYFVNHRESQPHKGWLSCCIHGIDVDKTGIWNMYADKEPEYRWTSLSDLTPTIKKFWQQFPFEKLARVRFMKLEPDGYIAPHHDTPQGYTDDSEMLDYLIPINIAIDHPDNCHMVLKDHGIVPWNTGDVKLVNIKNYHSVVNLSEHPRMHLIAHGVVGNCIKEFSNLIARSYKKQYERSRI
jgi:hypothetical protein